MDQLLNSNQAGGQPEAKLHPDTHVGTVTLIVSDLQRSLSFYTNWIGLRPLSQEGGRVILGAGSRSIVILNEIPGAAPQPRGTTGLYHAAILFPDRRSLARKIAQLAALRAPMGYADHLVSEAFYLSDPDGNGLELYRDRPRSEWAWKNGQVQMANAAIDFDSLFAEVEQDDPTLSDPSAPDGTRLGHMHLRIHDLNPALTFYRDLLGFDLVSSGYPGALFLSAGGYHHHLGMNTWESRGGKPAPANTAGLVEFTIVLPDPHELERVVDRVDTAGVPVESDGGAFRLKDPSQNGIRLVVENAGPE